jgi:hypothetical protein
VTPNPPNFDELVGAEPTGSERERLRRAHRLLLQAGAPPELTPALERAPQVGIVSVVRRQQVRRRAMLLLAAALAIAAVFFAGYGVGGRGRSSSATGWYRALRLQGTAKAPNAQATLEVLQPKDGNWPMRLTVAGLPQARTSYGVYLVRGGRFLPCGTFVAAGGNRPLTVTLNAPYHLRSGDRWVVTRTGPSASSPGPTVLRPA